MKRLSTFQLIREQQTVEPTRFLTCTSCNETVEVFEVPFGHLDPLLYVCGSCLTREAR